MKITVWNEFMHERVDPRVTAIYPDGIHNCIKKTLEEAGHTVRTATLDEPECGLTEEVLNDTDVLYYWAHCYHSEVPDYIANRIYSHVLRGMGLVVLHSGHASKIFQKISGGPSDLKWRETNDKEILWVVNPGHPIAAGIGDKIVLEHEETYGEHFNIGTPDEIVFVSWFSGGEVFRSGIVYKRGLGKVFYFRPGHETLPAYHNEKVKKVLVNAASYCYTPVRDNYVRGWVQNPPAEEKID